MRALRDIARATGYTKSPVRLALIDNPREADATRMEIKAMARKLNYRPSPAFRQMLRQVHDRQTVHYRPIQDLIYIRDRECHKICPICNQLA